MTEPEILTAADVHIWRLRPDEVTTELRRAVAEPLLAPPEREAAARRIFERHRHRFILTRALVRRTLSRYAPVAPTDWIFDVGPQGKPGIESPRLASPPRFNISHADGCIVCAVTLGHDVGVDVEHPARRASGLSIARRFFAPAEVRDLAGLAREALSERFFAYWTLKEAYIKARGLGLSLPLRHFSFELLPAAGARIHFAPELDDDPTHWQFLRMSLDDGHTLALAIRRGLRPDLDVELREAEW